MKAADRSYSDSAKPEHSGQNPHRPEPTAAERLEQAHRIPLGATFVFVLTMLAIWLMGRQLGG